MSPAQQTPASDYQREHVRFISGHSGTCLTELAALMLSWLLLVTINGCLQLRFRRLTDNLVFEISLVILSEILLVTYLSAHVYVVFVCLLAAAGVLLTCAAPAGPAPSPSASAGVSLRHCVPAVTVIAQLRGSVFLMTALCILAVDFAAFPRRLAKAETFGCGLMDLGVGMFTVLHGLCSARRGADGRLRPRGLGGQLRSALALTALGGTRLALVKALCYHEHVTEYGAHANFFMTLAAVHAVCAVVVALAVGERVWRLVAAAVAATGAQHALLHMCGWQHWVLSGDAAVAAAGGAASRSDWSLMDANREAVTSLCGFVALYLAGAVLRHCLERLSQWWPRASTRVKLVALLVFAATAVWCRWLPIDGVSRRLCNASYIVLVTGMMTVLLLVLLLVVVQAVPSVFVDSCGAAAAGGGADGRGVRHSDDTLFPCRLTGLASRHGLLLFCLANVATGAVNMSVSTIHCPDWLAILILAGYMTMLVAVLHYFDLWKNSPTVTSTAHPAKIKRN